MGWFLFLWSGREKSPSLRGIETGRFCGRCEAGLGIEGRPTSQPPALEDFYR